MGPVPERLQKQMYGKIDIKSFISIRFLSAIVILASAAIWVRPAVQNLAVYYGKKPIAIRRPLKDFDLSRLPSFKTGWNYKWLTAPVEDVGTDESVLVMLTNKKYNPELIYARLFVTYYCNPEDKVPHTPDVCARQSGAIVRKMSTIMLDIPQLAQDYPPIKARLLFLEMPQYNMVFIYVFCVEGQFKYTRGQVRWVMATPGNRHGYFSKIEATVYYPSYGDPAEFIPLCKSLICEAIPVLVKEHFPSNEQLKRR